MLMKTYITNSRRNDLNKELILVDTYTIKLKNDTDIIRPTIILKMRDFPKFNYVYLEDFLRCYFVKNVTILGNNLFQIDLEIDVLQSYKTKILNAKIHVEKSYNNNKYLDGEYNAEVKKETTIYESEKDLGNEEVLLLVAYGVYQ